MMKVSFDFDSTLTLPIIQQLVIRHIKFGDDVHITTTRRDGVKYLEIENSDLFAIADNLGIKKENVHFTTFKDKVHFLKTFDIHYDDDEYEIDLITRSELTCLGILINYKNYYLDNQ